MKTQLETRLLLAGVLFILLFGMVAPVRAEPLTQTGGSPMVPLLGLIGSWFRRNRTYRNAEDFISFQRQEYVDRLNTLNRQLAAGTIYTAGNADPGAQQAAYVKVKALLEQERDQAFAFGESIKNGARKDFNKAVKQQVLNVVLSTGFAQNVLGALNNGFGQAGQLVDGAISELSGNGTGDIAGQIRGLRNIAGQLQLVGSIIGGETGANLYGTVQGVLNKVNSQVSFATDELTNIKSDLAAVQTKIQGLMAQGYIPTSSEVTNSLALQLVGLGSGTPATEAILSILSVRSGMSREAIRSRGMLLLQAGENARCRKIISDLQAALQQLEAETVDENSSDSTGNKCTEIQADDLTSGAATGEATAAIEEQVTPGERLSAAECDASKLVSVSGTVEWTLPGVLDRKCHEPLVFTYSAKTNEDITVFVHMIQTGVQPFDGWLPDYLTPGNPTAGGNFDIWWSSDETIQYPEFIAVYWTYPKYSGCQWVGDDPEVSGLQPLAIPSSCP
jgi:hypothetical protein